jgi:hypothetical protein
VEAVKRHTAICVAAGTITPEEKERAVNLFRERFGYEHPSRFLRGAL